MFLSLNTEAPQLRANFNKIDQCYRHSLPLSLLTATYFIKIH